MIVQKSGHTYQKAPHLNSKKTDTINLFSEQHILQSDEKMKLHLYQFILIHKQFYMYCSMDKMCSNYGHNILIYPLPPQ